MRRRLLLETTVVAILFLGSVAYGRTWTDDTGKFSIEAEFVEEAGEKVRLKKPDGMIIDVPLAKLCLADRQFVGSQRDNKTVDPFAPASQKPVQPASTSADLRTNRLLHSLWSTQTTLLLLSQLLQSAVHSRLPLSSSW